MSYVFWLEEFVALRCLQMLYHLHAIPKIFDSMLIKLEDSFRKLT
jgi:hypothetical protein